MNKKYKSSGIKNSYRVNHKTAGNFSGTITTLAIALVIITFLIVVLYVIPTADLDMANGTIEFLDGAITWCAEGLNNCQVTP